MEDFKLLDNINRDILEALLENTTLNGLKEEIHADVRVLNPRELEETIKATHYVETKFVTLSSCPHNIRPRLL